MSFIENPRNRLLGELIQDELDYWPLIYFGFKNGKIKLRRGVFHGKAKKIR